MAGNENKRKAFERIEEFVTEENKIVIYKWLSQALSVDVDTAKDYLYWFIEENKSKYPINACYLLSGVQESANNTKVHKVIVTSQDKLEYSKSLFSTLRSCHVYSVQLSKIQDASVLYTAAVVSNNKLEDQQKYSGVKYDKVKIIPKRKSVEANTSDQTKITRNEQKDSTKLQPVQSKQKQNGLFSLWQKQQSRSAKVEKKESEIRPSESPPANSAGKKNVTHFPTREESTAEAKKAPAEKKDLKAEESSKREERKLPSKKENARKTERKVPSKLSRRRKHDQEHVLSGEEIENKPNKKKHKRIMQISDSESEVEDILSEEELDIQSKNILSEEELDIQSKRLRICEENLEENNVEEDNESSVPETNNRTLSYKTVNRTFVDEQGFMVTKKVKECIRESPKKEENPVAQEKKPVPSVILKENPTQKKQASLMSFFTKK